MTKHRMQLLLIAILLAALLVACGGGEAEPAAVDEAAEPGAAVVEEPAETEADEAASDELTVADIQQEGTLVVGTAITKPFEYHDPDTNELIGFDVDVANYIGDKLGVEVEFSEMPFASLIPSLQTRKVDMTIAAMYINPEREEVVDFATPYMETGLVMVVDPELEGEITTTEDLSGHSVGVKIGATGDALAQELIAQGIDLERREYKETLESFADLEAGRIDAVLNDYLNTLSYLNDTGSELKIVSDENGEPLFLSNVGLGIAVHDGDADLLAAINDALAEMQADGTYDELFEKWLGVARGE
ncbi:MAG: transporter substrate-binding domain-containing protein [Anaerolineae bacterium]|nr:transporter substrate-binding domain-containing protein [Anaerolineae bacterium]